MKGLIRLWGAALALALGTGALARAQEAAPPVKHYYNKTTFRIPVAIDEQERASLAELKLFVRQSPGDWVCAQTAPATQKSFSFQAQADGEYSFNIATVDRAGKIFPEDPRQGQPALIVVVDTQAPEIDVKPTTNGGGQVYLQCRLIDANPDYSSIKIQYQGSDGSWQPLDGLANAPGVIQVPDPHMLDGKIRVRAGDRAGNVSERELDLNSPRVATTPSALKSTPPRIPAPDEPAVAMPPPRPVGAAESLTPPSLDGPGSSVVVPTPAPAAVTANKPKPAPSNVEDGSSMLPRSNVLERSSMADPLVRPDLASDGVHHDGAPSAIINSTHCRLDFAVDQVAGGIAEVEVWASSDGGRTWKPVGVSKDGKSPAVVEFPGEGKYGIAFVVKPVAGLTTALPKAGEAPDGWLEIDTTLPVAELTSAVPGTGADTGFLVLHWIAKDANLGNEPIAFWYASHPGGPWQLLSDHMANSGAYRWPLPKNVGSHVWIRMEARDRAGNVTRCETPQPVALEGPRARVRLLNMGAAKE